MAYKTTLKLEVKVDKGPSIAPTPQDLVSISYMPVQVEVKADKQWTPVTIDGGESKWLQLMLVSSDKYHDKTCPSKKPALFFKFLTKKELKDKKLEDGLAYPMSGPLFFSTYTLAMLPDQVECMAFRNLMSETATIDIVLTKTDTLDPEQINVGPVPKPAAP